MRLELLFFVMVRLSIATAKHARRYQCVGAVVQPGDPIYISTCNTRFLIAKHVYSRSRKQLLLTEIEPYDTLFVDFDNVQGFARKILHKISVPFVLITGKAKLVNWQAVRQNHSSDLADVYGFDPEKLGSVLLENRYLLHWFTQNPWKVHPKLHGWPYGNHRCADDEYLKLAASVANGTIVKDQLFFLSHLRTEMGNRDNIPNGHKLVCGQYLYQLARSRYVISPGGDRPDCFRHWEAIGLGTIPITNINSTLYRFMSPAGTIFVEDEDLYDLDALKRQLDPSASANAKVAYMDYWKAQAENIVGKPLGWMSPPDSPIACQCTHKYD